MNALDFEPLWSDLVKLALTHPAKSKAEGLGKPPRPIQEVWRRALLRVVEQGECIIWRGARDRRGYGFIHAMGRQLRTHRFFYVAKYGPILPDQEVCHRCDETSCCNPLHLFAAPHLANMRDMVGKGRGNHPVGQSVNTNKLTPQQVIEIHRRASKGERQVDIARAFSVSQTTVSKIKLNQSWKHLPLE